MNDQGERGKQGLRGERGLPGESGVRGVPGATGPRGEPWPLSRKLSVVLAVNVLAVLAIAVGLVLTIVTSAQAREENCARVATAFDVFTDVLIATAAENERTPEERTDFEATAALFRARVHDALEECS